MVYALSVKITIGPHTLNRARRVLIDSSWQELGDTCTLYLSDFKELMRNRIQSGMKVSVALGCNGELRKEFEGYVVHVSPGIPFEIACEDELYRLKRLWINQGKGKAWKNISLKRMLSEILKPVRHRLSQKIPDVRLDQYRIDQGATLAEALQKIKEDFSLCAYLRNGNLFVGPPYAEISDYKKEEGTFACYDLHGDVVDNKLVFRRKEELKFLVKAISILADHQKITAQAGDPGGETHIVYHPGEKDAAKLKQIARTALARYKFDGYEGSFLTFGLPYIVHSGVVELRDARYPASQGRYRVKRVKTSWGTEGFRRRIEPGPKLEELPSTFASSNSQEPYIQEREKQQSLDSGQESIELEVIERCERNDECVLLKSGNSEQGWTAEFLQNPVEFFRKHPISTALADKERWQSGKQKFKLIENKHGAKYFLATSDMGDKSIQAYWLPTKKKIEVDLNNDNEPSFIFTPELQGCALYFKLYRDQGKMSVFHRMFGNLENTHNRQKETSESERLQSEDYTPILQWEEYGMSSEEYQKSIEGRTSFIPVTALFYRHPETGWNLLYQKIEYKLNGVPQPNFDYIKSITKKPGLQSKYINFT